MKLIIRLSLLILFLIAIGGQIQAQTTDLSNAKIVCAEKNDPVILKAIAILQEEISKRSQIQLQVVKILPKKNAASVIVIGLESKLTEYTSQLAQLKVRRAGHRATAGGVGRLWPALGVGCGSSQRG